MLPFMKYEFILGQRSGVRGLLQLRFRQDGGQRVSPDSGLASSVIGARVAHALLV